MSDFLINTGLWITYLMIIGGALAAIAFPVMFLIKNPKKGKNTMKYIGGLILILLISYLLASSEIMEFPGSEKFGMDSDSTKRVGMGLICFYLLALGAIGSVLYAEVGKFFKK